MPITQQQVIDLMQESRGNIQINREFCHQLMEYIVGAKARFYMNEELVLSLSYVEFMVKNQKPMVDKWTERNEYRYRSAARRRNDTLRERLESKRRAVGIPTAEEANAILQAKNALHRAGLPTNPREYMGEREHLLENLVGIDEVQQLAAIRKSERDYQKFSAEHFHSTPIPREAKITLDEELMPYERRVASGGKAKIIFPRDYDDDKELEFETLDELAPIANLPTGAVDAIVDPLAQGGENNSQTGVDNTGSKAQDTVGNPPDKESGT